MLILARHGRTAANAAGELLGRRNPPLDSVGRDQAARIATVLPPVHRIISSPLLRCMETALAIQSEGDSSIEIEIDQRFVEIDYGTLEGLPVSQVPADTWVRWRSEPGPGLLAGPRASLTCHIEWHPRSTTLRKPTKPTARW